MSEWLGTGLQNRLHQFESGWNLLKATPSMEIGGVVLLFGPVNGTFLNGRSLTF